MGGACVSTAAPSQLIPMKTRSSGGSRGAPQGQRDGDGFLSGPLPKSCYLRPPRLLCCCLPCGSAPPRPAQDFKETVPAAAAAPPLAA